MEDRIRAAAIVQTMVGFTNVLVVSWVSMLFWTYFGGLVSLVVIGLCTLGMCPLPVGIVCGFAGFVIGAIGVLELSMGIVGLTNPTAAARWMKSVAGLGIASIVLVNPVSVIGGMVVFLLLSGEQPEPLLIEAE